MVSSVAANVFQFDDMGASDGEDIKYGAYVDIVNKFGGKRSLPFVLLLLIQKKFFYAVLDQMLYVILR